jgi:protein-arginine kinase
VAFTLAKYPVSIFVFLTSCHTYSVLIHARLLMQAEALVQTADVQLAVNLHVREEVSSPAK